MVRRDLKKLLAAAAAAVALLGAGSPADLRASLRTTAQAYLANVTSIATIVGRESTFDYLQRLGEDADQLDNRDVPEGYTREQWTALVREIATLDLSLARQLLSKSYQPMASIRGLGETFVRSSKDGTMQPVAVYVPSRYVPGRAAPLIVFLHGHPQSESQLLGPQYVHDLAERTGTIVVAPYGRGYYDFRDSATDVYDALDAAGKAFTIDARKRFLVGYSMGGFSVFEVAPIRPSAWSAVMCIAGALLGHDAHMVTSMLPNTPFYVLTGARDESIPTKYPTSTAVFLRVSGVPVSYYSQPDGIHRLVTLLPILTQAWNDMHNGIVRSPPPDLGGFSLPSAPMGMTKP